MDNSNGISLPESWQHWTIEECLGHGSYGSVYLAVSDRGEPDCAVKIIRLPSSEAEAEAAAAEHPDPEERYAIFAEQAEGLLGEIRMMEQMKENPNVVRLLDHYIDHKEGELSWTIYLRMELLTPLPDYLILQEMTQDDVLALGIDLCGALEDFERFGLIHRDIKPENILIDEEGRYRLGDFGIARKMEQSTAGMSLRGTFSYMAPEIYHGRRYDYRADQYSLGLVLYRLMNNNRAPLLPTDQPIVSVKDREAALIKRMEGEALPRPEQASNAFGMIIRKACSYRPEDRFKSAALFREALIRCRDEGEYEGSGPVEISEEDRQNAEKKRAARKRRAVFIAAVAALAVIFAVVLWRQTREPEDVRLRESARETEAEIEADGIRADNALVPVESPEDPDFPDAAVVLSLIREMEEQAERENGGVKDQADHYAIKLIYQSEEEALGFSVNYKLFTDSLTNTEQVWNAFIFYYFVKQDDEWVRFPNDDIPESVWEEVCASYLPAGFSEAQKAGRNCYFWPEGVWSGEDAWYEGGVSLRTGAVWQNADGSADVYLICRNGTDHAQAEYGYWLSIFSETDLLKAFGHLDPGIVTVPERTAAGYLLHLEPGAVSAEPWGEGEIDCYTAGNNSNYNYQGGQDD